MLVTSKSQLLEGFMCKLKGADFWEILPDGVIDASVRDMQSGKTNSIKLSRSWLGCGVWEEKTRSMGRREEDERAGERD